MEEMWIAITRGGGSEERPEEFRACGPFPSFEVAEHWMEQEFGPPGERLEYHECQVIRIESPEEF